MTTGCVSITLVQDNLVERTETMLVRMISTTPQLIMTNSQADFLTVSIEDSDSEPKPLCFQDNYNL